MLSARRQKRQTLELTCGVMRGTRRMVLTTPVVRHVPQKTGMGRAGMLTLLRLSPLI